MNKKVLILILLLVVLSINSGCINTDKAMISEVDELQLGNFFTGYDGCFILYDESENNYSIYNEKQADERLSPCSTFKIPNSLIGLETGVILGENFTYEWDGKQYPIHSWNKEHTLETAMENSVVWYYQRLDENIGEATMQQYLDNLNYGNKDISGGIDKFWLGSTLEISAREQVEFLRNLYYDKLPLNDNSMEIVREIIILESNDDFIFSGKTGSSAQGLGWFIGTIQTNDNMYYFALNIKGEKDATGTKAKEISVEILQFLGIYNN